jgi:hypothetical protein
LESRKGKESETIMNLEDHNKGLRKEVEDLQLRYARVLEFAEKNHIRVESTTMTLGNDIEIDLSWFELLD